MHAIRVQYTVRDDFIETNEANIRRVMGALRELGDCGVHYSAFRPAGGATFVHVVVMEDESKRDVVPGLRAFQEFQAALRTGLVEKPQAEDWTVVGSSLG